MPTSVVADIGDLSVASSTAASEWIASGWGDIENWGVMVLTFDDGTKAVLSGSDGQLGGLSSTLQVSLSNTRIECQMSPTDLCRAYTPDRSVFGAEYLLEKLETSSGWSMVAPDEPWAHGHVQQIQDFIESVASDRSPVSDGDLGRQVIEVIYAAYVAAEEGRRVSLSSLKGNLESTADSG